MNTVVDLRPNISVQGQRTTNNTTNEDNEDDIQTPVNKNTNPSVNYRYIIYGVIIVLFICIVIFIIYRYRNKNNNTSDKNTVVTNKNITPVVEKLEETNTNGVSSEDAFLNATNYDDDKTSSNDGYEIIQKQNEHKVVENKQVEQTRAKAVDIYDPVTKTYTPHPTKVGDNEIININIESDDDEQSSTPPSPHQSTQKKQNSESVDLINIPQGVRTEAMASTNKSGQLLNRENITPQELKNITKIYNGKKFSKFITGKTVSNLLKKVVIN